MTLDNERCIYMKRQSQIFLTNCIIRLNSGIRNRYNFFLWSIFLFLKVGNESVNHVDSGDIKLFFQFPGNSILKISLRF